MHLLFFSLLALAPDGSFRDADHAFREAKELVAHEQVDAPDDAALLRDAVEGMVTGGGRRKWDALIAPADLSELKSGLSGEVVGIGVEIRFDPDSGVATIVDVLPGSPAEKAGLSIGE